MSSKDICIEYLIIIDSKNNFCDDKSSFNNLLSVNSDIKINKDKLNYKEVVFDYKVQETKLEEEKMSFHVYFKNKNFNNIGIFENFLRNIKIVFGKIGANLHTLRDDLSLHYSQKAYPQIHQIENSMRKLITEFMITNVGIGWIDKHIPNEVKKSKSVAKDSSNINYLYSLDFIQLSNILFKEYSPYSVDDLFKKISSTSNKEELNLENLKEFIPSSNWERYFSEIVKCDADYLKNRWDKIYELRNKVAHNNIFSKNDYEILEKNINEVKEKLEKAVFSLNNITVSEEDKQIISDNMIFDNLTATYTINDNSLYFKRNKFLTIYTEVDYSLEQIIKGILNINQISMGDLFERELIEMPITKKISWIYDNKIEIIDSLVSKNLISNMSKLQKFRNYIVHTDVIIKDELEFTLNEALDIIVSVLKQILLILNQVENNL